MSDIPSWARVGAKVVCVSDGWYYDSPSIGETGPAYGDVVTIRRVSWDGHGVGLELVGWPEATELFAIEGFRPLVSQSDDLEAHFYQLLNVPIKAREAA